MIAAQRRAMILEQLRRDGAASITALSNSIEASPSTIRRDLDFLTRDGYIVRSHGGALLNEPQRTTFEPAREIGAHVARSAKVAIGTRAAALIQPGQSVIFDSSSTVLEAARVIVERDVPLTACTNDLATATVLARSDRLQLVVLGGTTRRGSLTLIGDPGLGFLERLHADVAFIGIHSLFGGRLSETSIDLAAMKQRMIASARRAIVLADSSKFSHPAFCDVCLAGEVHAIVTDEGIGPRDREQLAEAGVELIIAGMPCAPQGGATRARRGAVSAE